MYVLCFKTTQGEVVGEGIDETILMTWEFLKLGDGLVGAHYISLSIFIYIWIFWNLLNYKLNGKN